MAKTNTKKTASTNPPKENEENKNFIQEVDDALREEKMRTLWKKYKFVLFGTVGLVLAWVVGSHIWQNNAYQSAQNEANTYITASEKKDVQALETLLTSKSGYQALAAFKLAEIALEKGDVSTATAHYNFIAEQKNLPLFIQQLAAVYAALSLLDNAPEEAKKRLVLLSDENAPFRASALELQGHLYAQNNEKATALTFYEEILAQDALPTTLKDRAAQAITTLQ